MNEKIWLIDMGDDIVWCNEPYPDDGIECDDSTSYVRMDIHQALEKENAELKVRLIKGQESFELVLDNTASDKATISLLCDALDEAATTINANVGGETKVKEYRALAKQHKQG